VYSFFGKKKTSDNREKNTVGAKHQVGGILLTVEILVSTQVKSLNQ